MICLLPMAYKAESALRRIAHRDRRMRVGITKCFYLRRMLQYHQIRWCTGYFVSGQPPKISAEIVLRSLGLPHADRRSRVGLPVTTQRYGDIQYYFVTLSLHHLALHLFPCFQCSFLVLLVFFVMFRLNYFI